MAKLLEKTLRAIKWGALAIASTFIANQALSQSTGTLDVIARSNPNNEPIKGATVHVYQKSNVYTQITDNTGLAVFTGLPTGVNKPKPLPEGYDVPQNYPNPFNKTTRIQVIVPKMSNVDLDVYNVIGQLVLHKAINATPGTNIIEEELQNNASGVYIARITIDKQYTKAIKEIHLNSNTTITNNMQFSEPTQSGRVLDPNNYTSTSSTHNNQSMNSTNTTENTNSGVGIDSITIEATKASAGKTGNAKKTITGIPVFNGTYTENISIEKTYLMNGKIYNLWKWTQPDSNAVNNAKIIIDNKDTTYADANGQYETSITTGTHTANITANGYYERNTAIEMTPTSGKITKKHNFNIADKTTFPTSNMDKYNQQWRASEWPNTQPIHGNTRWEADSTTYQHWWIDTTNIYKFKNDPQTIIDTIISIVRREAPLKTPANDQGIYNNITFTISGQPPFDPINGYPEYTNYRLIQFGKTGAGLAETGGDRDFAHNNVDKVIYAHTTFDTSLAHTTPTKFDEIGAITSAVVHEVVDLGDGGLETFPDSTGSSLEAPVRNMYLTTFDRLARLFRYSRTIGNWYSPSNPSSQDNDKGLDPEPDDTNR